MPTTTTMMTMIKNQSKKKRCGVKKTSTYPYIYVHTCQHVHHISTSTTRKKGWSLLRTIAQPQERCGMAVNRSESSNRIGIRFRQEEDYSDFCKTNRLAWSSSNNYGILRRRYGWCIERYTAYMHTYRGALLVYTLYIINTYNTYQYPLWGLYSISAQNGYGKSSCWPWQHPGESPTYILHKDKT